MNWKVCTDLNRQGRNWLHSEWHLHAKTGWEWKRPRDKKGERPPPHHIVSGCCFDHRCRCPVVSCCFGVRFTFSLASVVYFMYTWNENGRYIFTDWLINYPVPGWIAEVGGLFFIPLASAWVPHVNRSHTSDFQIVLRGMQKSMLHQSKIINVQSLCSQRAVNGPCTSCRASHRLCQTGCAPMNYLPLYFYCRWTESILTPICWDLAGLDVTLHLLSCESEDSFRRGALTSTLKRDDYCHSNISCRSN